MRDGNIVFRAPGAGNLTGNFTSAWLDLKTGGVMHGLDVSILVPAVQGAGDKISPKFEYSNDGAAVLASEVGNDITVVGNHYRTAHMRGYRYVRITLATTDGAADGVNFGAVEVYAATGKSYREYDNTPFS